MKLSIHIKHFRFAINAKSITARYKDSLWFMLSLKHGLRVDYKPFETTFTEWTTIQGENR